MCINIWGFSPAYDGSTGECKLINGLARGHGTILTLDDLGIQRGIRLRAYVAFDGRTRPSARLLDDGGTTVAEVTDKLEMTGWCHHRWHFATLIVRAFDSDDKIIGEASEDGHRFGVVGVGTRVNPLEDRDAVTRVAVAAFRAAGCTTAATVAA